MTPYLHAPPQKIEEWRPIITGDFKIGFSWAGSKAPGYGKQDRNAEPADFARLVRTPGTTWYSLQRDEAPCGLPLQAVGEFFGDLSDTAGAIANLDLLIVPDCVLAHLAGAMGVSCFLFLPVSSDWRWLTERGDTPWYSSVTLFRQTEAGDWLSVMERIERELARTLKSKKQFELKRNIYESTRGKLLEEAANREQKESAGVASAR